MTSITVEREVKEEHEDLKPESLTWSDYLHILAHSIDAKRFEELVETFYEREYEAAVERARERYAKTRTDPERLLDADEARRRVRDEKGSE